MAVSGLCAGYAVEACKWILWKRPCCRFIMHWWWKCSHIDEVFFFKSINSFPNAAMRFGHFVIESEASRTSYWLPEILRRPYPAKWTQFTYIIHETPTDEWSIFPSRMIYMRAIFWLPHPAISFQQLFLFFLWFFGYIVATSAATLMCSKFSASLSNKKEKHEHEM